MEALELTGNNHALSDLDFLDTIIERIVAETISFNVVRVDACIQGKLLTIDSDDFTGNRGPVPAVPVAVRSEAIVPILLVGSAGIEVLVKRLDVDGTRLQSLGFDEVCVYRSRNRDLITWDQQVLVVGVEIVHLDPDVV